MNGVDVSFSRVTREWCERRVSEGVRVFVACLWTGGYQSKAGIVAVAESNLRAAREAGMITAGYLNTNPWYDATASLFEAKFAAGAEWAHLSAVLNDVEIPLVTEAQVKAHCEAITNDGKQTAIYSARWFWSGKLGNPQWPWLRDYRIWVADYDGDPAFATTALYGPWTQADMMGKQFAGTTDIEGVDVDKNNFDLDWFGGQQPQTEEDDMALSPEAAAGIEAYFGAEFTDWLGRKWSNKAEYIEAAITALDAGKMDRLYGAIAASGGGGGAATPVKLNVKLTGTAEPQ